jgi:hypothetical protein
MDIFVHALPLFSASLSADCPSSLAARKIRLARCFWPFTFA